MNAKDQTKTEGGGAVASSDLLGEQLTIWLRVLDGLNDSKPAMDKFEKKMSKMVDTTLAKLHKDIEAAIKELESETGDDWSPYLEDFDVYDWQPGDFQESIGNWLKEQIKMEAAKIT